MSIHRALEFGVAWTRVAFPSQCCAFCYLFPAGRDASCVSRLQSLGKENKKATLTSLHWWPKLEAGLQGGYA
jgi:hypothetical protein